MKAIEQGLKSGILETCIEMIKEAKALAPWEEGRLRNSIMYKTLEAEGGFNDSGSEKADKKLEVSPKNLEAFVGSNLGYATYQEMGTRFMPPQPFLRLRRLG
jgi:HK97 gp10 family phage protein